jgi:hypothetical protein
MIQNPLTSTKHVGAHSCLFLGFNSRLLMIRFGGAPTSHFMSATVKKPEQATHSTQ